MPERLELDRAVKVQAGACPGGDVAVAFEHLVQPAHERDALDGVGAARALVGVEPQMSACVLGRTIAGVEVDAAHARDEQDLAKCLVAHRAGRCAGPHALDGGEGLGQPGRRGAQTLAQLRIARRLADRPRGGGGARERNRIGVAAHRRGADALPGLGRALDAGVETALAGQAHRPVGDAPRNREHECGGGKARMDLGRGGVRCRDALDALEGTPGARIVGVGAVQREEQLARLRGVGARVRRGVERHCERADEGVGFGERLGAGDAQGALGEEEVARLSHAPRLLVGQRSGAPLERLGECAEPGAVAGERLGDAPRGFGRGLESEPEEHEVDGGVDGLEQPCRLGPELGRERHAVRGDGALLGTGERGAMTQCVKRAQGVDGQ